MMVTMTMTIVVVMIMIMIMMIVMMNRLQRFLTVIFSYNAPPSIVLQQTTVFLLLFLLL